MRQAIIRISDGKFTDAYMRHSVSASVHLNYVMLH